MDLYLEIECWDIPNNQENRSRVRDIVEAALTGRWTSDLRPSLYENKHAKAPIDFSVKELDGPFYTE